MATILTPDCDLLDLLSVPFNAATDFTVLADYCARFAWKLEQQQQENSAVLKSQRRMFHHQIERGNPRRTFTGMAFIEG